MPGFAFKSFKNPATDAWPTALASPTANFSLLNPVDRHAVTQSRRTEMIFFKWRYFLGQVTSSGMQMQPWGIGPLVAAKSQPITAQNFGGEVQINHQPCQADISFDTIPSPPSPPNGEQLLLSSPPPPPSLQQFSPVGPAATFFLLPRRCKQSKQSLFFFFSAAARAREKNDPVAGSWNVLGRTELVL